MTATFFGYMLVFLVYVKASFLNIAKEISNDRIADDDYESSNVNRRRSLYPNTYSNFNLNSMNEKPFTGLSASTIIGGHIHISSCNTNYDSLNQKLIYALIYFDSGNKISLYAENKTNVRNSATTEYNSDTSNFISIDFVVVNECKFMIFPGKNANTNLFGKIISLNSADQLTLDTSSIDDKPLTPFDIANKNSPTPKYSKLISSTIIGNYAFVLALNKM